MKVGSLFTGYGGLDLAVGGDMSWYSEIDSAACTILKSHYSDVVNIGDITEVDWSAVEPVDVLTGGYPCQPFSTAGKRKGESDERHLWPYVREAIRALEPRVVVLENVRGHLTLGFSTVLGEVADLGYSARWGVVRASDAGAPHQRARLFIVAHPKGTDWGVKKPESLAATAGGATESRERGGENTWGTFTAAIKEWERHTGRICPTPWVEDKVNPLFVEWMMGLPEGWVTGHGLSASEELRMLGNGVVPQQAELALELLEVYS